MVTTKRIAALNPIVFFHEFVLKHGYFAFGRVIAMARKIYIDKISSVTKNINLPHEVEISDEVIAKEGMVLAVRVMQDRSVHNLFELVSGRMSVTNKGDILAVALGNRRALKRFVGEIPKKVAVDDVLHLLSAAGIAGICTSANKIKVSNPVQLKVLGAIKGPDGPLSIHDYAKFPLDQKLEKSHVPLILITGTCMHVGKTSVACEIVKFASRRRFKIHAAKMSGIAGLADVERVRDNGARDVLSIIDAGFTSTVTGKDKVIGIVKGAINYLSRKNPNAIVIEFGDGVFGEYGVLHILEDKEIQKRVAVHIGCAHDPMGALKLHEVCTAIDMPLTCIAGPITDNEVGKRFIQKKLGIQPYNALLEGEELFQYVWQKIANKRAKKK